jgi:hypothetical protein
VNVGKLVFDWDEQRRRGTSEPVDARARIEFCHDVLLYGTYDHPWHRHTIELPRRIRTAALLEAVERRLGLCEDPPADEDALLWRQIRFDYSARYAGAPRAH